MTGVQTCALPILAIDSENTIYLTGGTKGLLDSDGVYSGEKDFFLMSIDFQGNQNWVKQIGTSSDDIGISLGIDFQNNIYVVGNTFGDFNSNLSYGNGDFFIMKLDKTGNIIWDFLKGSLLEDQVKSVNVSVKGLIYFGGFIKGNYDNYSIIGDSDIFINCLNPYGK